MNHRASSMDRFGFCIAFLLFISTFLFVFYAQTNQQYEYLALISFGFLCLATCFGICYLSPCAKFLCPKEQQQQQQQQSYPITQQQQMKEQEENVQVCIISKPNENVTNYKPMKKKRIMMMHADQQLDDSEVTV